MCKIHGCECYSKGTYDENCGGSISRRWWIKESQTGHKDCCFDECKSYVANEPSIIGQIVLSVTCIVLPQSLQARALNLAHKGHLGIAGTKQNLRSKVWWPAMEKDAERHVRSCYRCQLVMRPDKPEPLRMTQLPETPLAGSSHWHIRSSANWRIHTCSSWLLQPLLLVQNTQVYHSW